MPRVSLESTTSVFEPSKTFHALDRVVTVIGSETVCVNGPASLDGESCSTVIACAACIRGPRNNFLAVYVQKCA
jgi:hypothetical protein